jgi:hypothetical protein
MLMSLNFNKLSILTSTMLLVAVTVMGQSLPSSQYDDYDLEKYSALRDGSQTRANQATDELNRSERALQDAQTREDSYKRDMERATRESADLRRRYDETARRIQETQAWQHQARQAIERGNFDIQTLTNQVNEAQGSATRLRQIADGLKGDMDRAGGELTAANSVAQAQQRIFNQADAALNAQNALIEKLNRDLSATTDPAAKAAIQTQLTAELAKLPELMSAKSGAFSALKSAQDVAGGKQAAFNSAKSRFDAAQTEVNGAQARLNGAQNSLNSKRTEVEKMKSDMAQSQRNENEMNNQMAEMSRRNRDLNNHIADLDGKIRYAIAETNQRRYERDQAQISYNTASVDLQNAQSRLSQVANYIEQARQAMQSAAVRDASVDGDREGRELGQFRGERDGRVTGLRDGDARGTADGKSRDYADGRNKGISQSQADAPNPKTVPVSRDGSAYADGKKAGYDFGYSSSNNQVSYKIGREAGEKNGSTRAYNDAQVREPVGYSEREQTYLNAPLKKVNLGEVSLLSNFKGAQGRYSDDGEDKYYNPRPGNVPHPRIKQFYMGYYDSTYREVLARVYRSNYDSARDAAYSSNYASAKKAALAKDYPESRTLGYNQAYLGFAEGNAQGSQQKGFDEGDRAAYAAKIEGEKTKAYNAGVARCDALYTKNPVIKVVSIDLVDSDRDGINRPGETVQAIYVVKNFGLVAKTDLNAEASVQSGSASVVEARAAVPSLPPQSEATVAGKAQIRIADAAADGSSMQVAIRLVDKNEVSRQSFSRQILYPTVAQIVDFDGVIIPEQETKIKVTLSNRSRSAQALTVDMSTEASKIQVNQSQLSIDSLAAGETKSLEFVARGNAEARFQESTIGFSVRQKGQVFGQTGARVTIIKRHITTSDSSSLILSQNLARGGGKAIYAFGGADTWDLRVDGVISAAILKDYSNKIVHVMADAGAAMDASSMRALTDYITGGGQVVVWGSDLDQSGIFNQLQSLAMVRASRSGNINETISGSLSFSGLSLSLNGESANLSTTTLKARALLESRYGVVATSAVANGIARNERVGRTYVLGFSPSEVSKESFNLVQQLVQSMAQTFEQKLESAAKDPRWMNMLILDIQEELLTSEHEARRLYLDNKKDNKSYKALERMIKSGVNAESKKAFARAYKTVADTLKVTPNISASVSFVLERGAAGPLFGSKTWLRLFCEMRENYSDGYCTNNGR